MHNQEEEVEVEVAAEVLGGLLNLQEEEGGDSLNHQEEVGDLLHNQVEEEEVDPEVE